MYNSFTPSTQLNNLQSGDRFCTIFKGLPTTKIYTFVGMFLDSYEVETLCGQIQYLDPFTLVAKLQLVPRKNGIDWDTRKAWLTKEIDNRFDLENENLNTLHKCIIAINVEYGVLSISQIYKALQDYPQVKQCQNQTKIKL